MLTTDGAHLFVQRRSDSDTTFELWSLETASVVARLDIAGTPALVSLDSSGQRIAIADYDRAVRVWDFRNGSLIVQIDLTAQPSEISLAAGGEVLGAVFGADGVTLWRIDRPTDPLLEEFADGRWQLRFSPSGTRVLVGRPERGFQVFETSAGQMLGPPMGSNAAPDRDSLLAFSADEQIVVTGGSGSVARFWRAPTLPAQNNTGEIDPTQSIWAPSGDSMAIATPDATRIIIGDQRGNVHILPADAGRQGLQDQAQELSFYGHNAEIRRLEVSPDGRLAASSAADNTVRIWNVADGLPQQFIADIPGAFIERLVFSPDASLLGVLNDMTAGIIDTKSGEMLAQFELGERHTGIAFADSDHLYLGSNSGALRVIARDAAGSWNLQSLWQGDAAINWLEASPRSQFLVLVDVNNLAQQFSLAEGRIGDRTLQLPSAVDEVAFTPGGLRVFFRTPNWIHRASSSVTGLIWLDAILIPKALSNTRMVFGDPELDEAAALGNRVFLPVAGDGYARLAELSFTASRGPGLFGNKDQLIDEWRRKLSLVTAQGSDE
jgi:WD40 repeat protein